jgi:hypothetical protein
MGFLHDESLLRREFRLSLTPPNRGREWCRHCSILSRGGHQHSVDAAGCDGATFSLKVTCSRPVRALMDAELARELIERQEFWLSRMFRHRHSGSLQHVRRRGSQSAVPHPKCVHGHVDQRGELLLRESGGTTEFAQGGHRVNTMHFGRCTLRATSGVPGR